jgi:hypothetical protein
VGVKGVRVVGPKKQKAPGPEAQGRANATL